MRLGSWLRLTLFALCLASLLLVPAAACHHKTASRQHPFPLSAQPQREGENQVLVYAEARSAAAEPFLSLQSDGGAVNEYTPTSDATSGPMTVLQGWQGQSPTPHPFTLSSGLAKKQWLNVSRYVSVTLYVSSQANQAASRENLQVRVELFAGPLRIGSDDCGLWAGDAANTKWELLLYEFPPEVEAIEPGVPLSLKVTRLSSLSDFVIGTGGDHQTRIEIRTYDQDPLSGTVYLVNGQIQPQPDLEGEASGDRPWGPWAGLLLLAPVARSRGARLATLLLVAGALSGCMGGGPGSPSGLAADGGSSTVQPTAVVRVSDRPDLAANEGIVKGRVHDDVGIGIPGANVLIVGTRFFTQTDAQGRFQFLNVSAGDYLLRAERQGFLHLEQRVTVQAGKELEVDITLVRPSATSSNDRPHRHFAWPEDGRFPLWSADVPANFGSLTVQSTTWYCLYYSTCEARVPLPQDKPVPEGSMALEVTLTWTAGSVGGKELGLRVERKPTDYGDVAYGARPPGQKFNVLFFPNFADPGHQKFTNWQMWIRVPKTWGTQVPGGPPANSGGTIHVEVVAIRGVTAFEPPHPDFWGNRTTIPLFSAKKIGPGACYLCDQPYEGNPNCQFYTFCVVSSKEFVPPGTKELRGTFSWTVTGGQNTAAHTQWKLVYQSAEAPPSQRLFRPITLAGTGNEKTFLLTPTTNEFDQFYQAQSYWYFWPDDGVEPFGPGVSTSSSSLNTQQGTSWTLTLDAVKDPLWDAAKAA